MIDIDKKINDNIKIINWWCEGMFQIGGDLKLFFSLGIDKITELYNVKL